MKLRNAIAKLSRHGYPVEIDMGATTGRIKTVRSPRGGFGLCFTWTGEAGDLRIRTVSIVVGTGSASSSQHFQSFTAALRIFLDDAAEEAAEEAADERNFNG